MKIQKVEKLVANLHDKTKYGIHIKNLKQVLNQRLVLKTVHRLIETNQKFWFKSYIDMNTGLIKRIKKNFEIYIYIYILKLMNNAVFGKTMENVGKHRDIKLLRQKKRRNYLVSEPNYYTMMLIAEDLLA